MWQPAIVSLFYYPQCSLFGIYDEIGKKRERKREWEEGSVGKEDREQDDDHDKL